MLNRVTFTGVDDRTNVNDLVDLTKRFPFVEFGVLISKGNTNRSVVNRYPNATIFKKLKNKGLNLSCHLCGSVARNIVKKDDWNEFFDLLSKDYEIFNRFQLNVSGVKGFSRDIHFIEEKDFIIQLKEDMSLYNAYKDLPNVFGFQDNSGGVGRFEDNWLDSDRYFGYAGGLNIDNVESVIRDLYVVNNADFWIDMETSVRTFDWFDINKCEQILKVCEPYVNKNIF